MMLYNAQHQAFANYVTRNGLVADPAYVRGVKAL